MQFIIYKIYNGWSWRIYSLLNGRLDRKQRNVSHVINIY